MGKPLSQIMSDLSESAINNEADSAAEVLKNQIDKLVFLGVVDRNSSSYLKSSVTALTRGDKLDKEQTKCIKDLLKVLAETIIVHGIEVEK